MKLPTRAAFGIAPVAVPMDDDAHVVADVLRGDRARFQALMQRHNRRVFRTTRSILRSDAEAEDAAQYAWLSAYQHLAQWDGRARFSTWLTRIAINAALRCRRTDDRIGRLALLEDVAADMRAPSPGPEGDLARVQARALIERAMDSLPEAFRVVLVLRDVEELSSAEAADTLGVTDEVVRVRLHRARRALRAQIEEEVDSGVGDIFPFDGARCDRIVALVMGALG